MLEYEDLSTNIIFKHDHKVIKNDDRIYVIDVSLNLHTN